MAFNSADLPEPKQLQLFKLKSRTIIYLFFQQLQQAHPFQLKDP